MNSQELKARSDPHTHDVTFEIVHGLIKSSDRVLDVGCGTGAFLYRLKSLVTERNGCDFNIKQYGEEENRDRIAKVNLDTENLPYPDDSFDLVFCLDVLEHLFSPYRLLGEILRVTKPNSCIVVSTPNVQNWIHRLTYGLVGRFQGFWQKEHNADLGERHYTPLFRDQLEEFIARGGAIVKEDYNRTIIPKLRIEIPMKNRLLSETVIWVIKKNHDRPN